MDQMSNLQRVNFFDCVITESRARRGKNVTENACGFVGDGVQVPGVELF